MNGRIKLLRLWYSSKKRLNALRGVSAGADMTTYIDFYRKTWSGAAAAIGAEFTELGRGLWRVSTNGTETFINNYIVQIDDPVMLNIAGNKALSYDFLKRRGLTVPAHRVYTLDTVDRALFFMEKEGGGFFVVKPSRGTSGARGVTTHVTSAAECMRASVVASLYSREILIERHCAGESYRLLVLDGELIHASRRRGLRVRGDGTSTVADLAEAVKEEPSRAPALRSWDYMRDRDFIATLSAQGLGPGSVPAKGQRVLLKSVLARPGRYSEVRTVYDEDATAEISEEIREEAVKAASAIGSRFAGVDIVTTDPGAPLRHSGGAIVEINTTPGLHHHYGLGTPDVPVAERVLRYLLETKRR